MDLATHGERYALSAGLSKTLCDQLALKAREVFDTLQTGAAVAIKYPTPAEIRVLPSKTAIGTAQSSLRLEIRQVMEGLEQVMLVESITADDVKLQLPTIDPRKSAETISAPAKTVVQKTPQQAFQRLVAAHIQARQMEAAAEGKDASAAITALASCEPDVLGNPALVMTLPPEARQELLSLARQIAGGSLPFGGTLRETASAIAIQIMAECETAQQRTATKGADGSAAPFTAFAPMEVVNTPRTQLDRAIAAIHAGLKPKTVAEGIGRFLELAPAAALRIARSGNQDTAQLEQLQQTSQHALSEHCEQARLHLSGQQRTALVQFDERIARHVNKLKNVEANPYAPVHGAAQQHLAAKNPGTKSKL